MPKQGKKEIRYDRYVLADKSNECDYDSLEDVANAFSREGWGLIVFKKPKEGDKPAYVGIVREARTSIGEFPIREFLLYWEKHKV
jgi:hypothetical protein